MYEEENPGAIKARMKEGLNTDLCKLEGTFLDEMFGPVSVELGKMYAVLNALQNIIWVDETSGEYLDMAAEDLGIEPRKAGTAAEVVLLVEGEPGYILPTGTPCHTGDGIYFDTNTDIIVPGSGETLVMATARKVGTAGNVPANTVIYTTLTDSRLYSITNPESGTGGADEESDKALFDRIQQARKRPGTSGNVYHYEKWALEVDGVGKVKVIRKPHGPGTVGVLIADENRQPVDDAIVVACQEHIEEEYPIGPELYVWPAQALPITIQAALLLDGSTNMDYVQRQFYEAVEKYLQSIALELTEIRYNRIAAMLLAIEGVIDYDSLIINGRGENIPLTERETPVLNEVLLI